MALARRDDYLTDAQGRALAGAQVYYCAPQPANISLLPPSPLAPTFSDLTGTPESNPQITDGFGHSIAYLDDTVLYTIVYVHPLFGPDPAYNNQPVIVLKDQSLGFGGGGGNTVTAFAGTPIGTIDGTNTTFTVVNGSIPLTQFPTQITAWLEHAPGSRTGLHIGPLWNQFTCHLRQPPATSLRLHSRRHTLGARTVYLMKKLIWLLLISLPVLSQSIDPRTQINWPRISGSGSPTSAGFGADCGTHYGQPYTDKSGPHYWVCTVSGWYQVDGSSGIQPNFKNRGTLLTEACAGAPQIYDYDDLSITPAAELSPTASCKPIFRLASGRWKFRFSNFSNFINAPEANRAVRSALFQFVFHHIGPYSTLSSASDRRRPCRDSIKWTGFL